MVGINLFGFRKFELLRGGDGGGGGGEGPGGVDGDLGEFGGTGIVTGKHDEIPVHKILSH